MGKFPQNNSINVLGELKVRGIYSDVRFQESVGCCSGSFGSFCVAGFVLWGRAGLTGPPPVWFWSRSQPESRERNHAEAVSEAGELGLFPASDVSFGFWTPGSSSLWTHACS